MRYQSLTVCIIHTNLMCAICLRTFFSQPVSKRNALISVNTNMHYIIIIIIIIIDIYIFSHCAFTIRRHIRKRYICNHVCVLAAICFTYSSCSCPSGFLSVHLITHRSGYSICLINCKRELFPEKYHHHATFTF